MMSFLTSALTRLSSARPQSSPACSFSRSRNPCPPPPFRAAGGCASPSPARSSASHGCCCSTSQPTTSTSMPSSGWRATCKSGSILWWSSRTIVTFSPQFVRTRSTAGSPSCNITRAHTIHSQRSSPRDWRSTRRSTQGSRRRSRICVGRARLARTSARRTVAPTQSPTRSRWLWFWARPHRSSVSSLRSAALARTRTRASSSRRSRVLT
mmetsp:Transcript_20628/g.62969  ORF Transcript_20628/g.62969 Transcript_20628/m.62969 type:complete len:210 (-) Transcript_20628:2120-2749(-)